MKTAIFTLESTSPLSQGRAHTEPKKDKETADAYEQRTWKSRLHVTSKGEVFLPPMMLKNALSEAAKFLGRQIPGKGKATYTKHFEAGVMCVDPLVLNVLAKDVQGETLFVPADGVRGSGKRVWKTFPFIPEWSAQGRAVILDDLITEEVFKLHLEEAGKFIGVGRFRPRQNGWYGRFRVSKFNWVE